MKKKKLVTSLAATSIIMSSMVNNVFADNNNILTDSVSTNTISTDNISNNTILTTTLEDGTVLATTLGGMNLINSSRSLSIKYNGSMTHVPVEVNGKFNNKCRIMTITSPNSNDSFKVDINYNGDKKDVFNDFIVAAKIIDKRRVDFKVITIDGASLGELTNSMSRLDSKVVCSYLGHEITQYTFHYSFFNYGERIINVNLNPVSKAPITQDCVVTEEQATNTYTAVVEDQNDVKDSIISENQAVSQDSVVNEEQSTNQDLAVIEDQADVQDSIVSENQLISQESVVNKEQETNQDLALVEKQANVQDTVVTENQVDIQENIVLE